MRLLSFLMLSIVIIICNVSLVSAAPSMTGDMLFNYGSSGWHAGLGLTQENIKPLGFIGYEKTGIMGYLSHDIDIDQVSSWIGGHRQVNVGNVGYTMEIFAANTQRPALSMFLDDMAPHIGAYGEYNRMFGEYGHGLSGKAQLYVDETGGMDYSIRPYLQLRRSGTWRLSANLGTSFGVGISYMEPSETFKLDMEYGEEGFSAYGVVDVPYEPMSIGAGWGGSKLQGFIRYTF